MLVCCVLPVFEDCCVLPAGMVVAVLVDPVTLVPAGFAVQPFEEFGREPSGHCTITVPADPGTVVLAVDPAVRPLDNVEVTPGTGVVVS